MAARIRSTAPAVSPSKNGSCSGCSPARKARASSGSPYPRRTSTLAVISLTPSAWASSLDFRCGHGRIVQVPCCIADHATEGIGQTRRSEPPTRRSLQTRRKAGTDSLLLGRCELPDQTDGPICAETGECAAGETDVIRHFTDHPGWEVE